MKLKEIVVREGMLSTKKFVEEPEIRPNNIKMHIRKDIRENVYDTEDAIADAFKISLANMSMIYRLFLLVQKLYVADSNENGFHEIIPADLETAIEGIMNHYKDSKTIFDLKVEKEGLAFIDKLINRQSKIAEIIEEKIN